MSAFDDVKKSVCQVLAEDGSLRGTGFLVLPDGHVVTCHHVVYGLGAFRVHFPFDDTGVLQASYDEELSNSSAGRRRVARGVLMALCVAAFGDADWQVHSAGTLPAAIAKEAHVPN